MISHLETLNLKLETHPTMKRRSFLTSAAALGASPLFANNTPVHTPKGKAEHCIFIWLGGGMGQIDTFDPKDLGDNLSKPSKPGSLYKSVETSVPGVRPASHSPPSARTPPQRSALAQLRPAAPMPASPRPGLR